MILTEVNNLLSLKKEINKLSESTKELEATNSNKDILLTIKHKMFKAELDYLRLKCKIEDFIFKIDDAEIRLLLSFKWLDFMPWDEIGKMLKVDRRTAARKYERYISAYLK